MYPPTCARDLPGPGWAPVPDNEEAFMPTPEQNKDTVSTFAREVFGNKDLGYASTWLADDFVEHQVFPGTTPDKHGAIDSYKIFFAAAPDMTAEVHDMVAAGDKVAIRATYRGTDRGGFIPGMPATGKTFAMDAIYLVRINEQGQIAEHWGVVDTIATMGQLGLLPSPDQALPA
jgi:steroid delta-isomerase-like uncharacterized protein